MTVELSFFSKKKNKNYDVELIVFVNMQIITVRKLLACFGGS